MSEYKHEDPVCGWLQYFEVQNLCGGTIAFTLSAVPYLETVELQKSTESGNKLAMIARVREKVTTMMQTQFTVDTIIDLTPTTRNKRAIAAAIGDD